MKQEKKPKKRFVEWVKSNRLKSIGAATAASVAFIAGLAQISGYDVRDVIGAIFSESTDDVPIPSDTAKSGWGPARPIYTLASGGAPYPAYNCIVDNSNYGDERNFATIRDVTVDAEGAFGDEAHAIDGHVYEIRILINNCGPDHDVDAQSSWIQDARLAIASSTGFQKDHFITVYLKGANVTQVWDNLKLSGDESFSIGRVVDGVRLHSNAHPIPGINVDESVFSSYGTPVGYEEMDGNIRPGYQYATYVYAKISVRNEN